MTSTQVSTGLPDDKQRAVVLLSGGLDSTTTLAIARSEGYEIHALTLRYGQRHEVEVEAAQLHCPTSSASPAMSSCQSTCASSAARP